MMYVRIVAPLPQCQATHKCAHNCGHHKIWMDSVAVTNLPSDFYLSGPLKGCLQKLHHVNDEAL